MSYFFFLLRIGFSEMTKRWFLTKSLLIALLYLFFAFFILNLRSILSILQTDYGFFAKAKIVSLILIGTFTSISREDLLLLSVIAFLFGVNVLLILRKLKFLKKQGSLQVTMGAGLISLVAAGCASCGLSIASFVGLTGAIAVLPFGGIELYFLSIGVLVISYFYNIHSYIKACNLR